MLASLAEEESASNSQPRTEHSSEKPASPLLGKRIVVVEDEGIIQLQLRRSLTHLGLIVAGVANSGMDGVEVVLRERPDLVLMDIRMPGEIDGLEAARQILAEYRVCVVMLTAYATEEYMARAKEIGTCGYLLKPFVGETLLAQLEQAYTSYE